MRATIAYVIATDAEIGVLNGTVKLYRYHTEARMALPKSQREHPDLDLHIHEVNLMVERRRPTTVWCLPFRLTRRRTR